MNNIYYYCTACGSVWFIDEKTGEHLYYDDVDNVSDQIFASMIEKYCGCND
jgi:hypothetical protein